MVIVTIVILLFFLAYFLIHTHYQYNYQYANEAFENSSTVQLDKDTIDKYNNFLAFYTQFCSSWQKAIQSAVALNIPQAPLTSPSQVSQVSQVSTPQIPESDMTAYIDQLSQKIEKSLPPICIQLPPINKDNLSDILEKIPKDSQPYINALSWMNEQMSNSHSTLDVALKGGSVEGFVNSSNMCKNISLCIDQNPELAEQITHMIYEKQKKNIKEEEEKLVTIINSFLTNEELTGGLKENIELVAKSQEIQRQAQSGELLNRISIPSKKTSYIIPPGGNKLSEMKQNNPNQYNNLKQNYSKWFNMKQLLEQINNNLQ